jgi:uncharacterized RDD family membrane protein YckC
MANGPTRIDTPLSRPDLTPPATGWAPTAESTGGVLSRRLFAYLIDLMMIALLAALLWVVIAIVGLITFGFGWVLFAILPFTGILYSAITVGGWKQSTIGMRMLGLRVVRTASDERVDAITAAVHALLFYVAAGTFVLWLIDVVIGVARSDRRLVHDLLVGLMVVRAP